MQATNVFTILLLLNFLKKMHNIMQYENQLKAGQILFHPCNWAGVFMWGTNNLASLLSHINVTSIFTVN